MKTNQILQRLGYVTAVALSIVAFTIVVSATWIGYEVRHSCELAQQVYDGDCVEALSQYVQDDRQTFANRNSAIWALGQLGDSRAVETLESMYTGNIPDREPWNETVSQYELRKALNLARGGTNITAWMWR